MSLLKPTEQMAVRELEGQIRYFESLANFLLEMREPLQSAVYRGLGAKYQEELYKRLGSLGNEQRPSAV